MSRKNAMGEPRPVGAGARTAPAGGGFVAEYSKSDVAHKTSRVFADAARGAVRLRVRSGRNFVLLAEDAYEDNRRRRTAVAQVLPLLRASVEQFPEFADFAWTASLSAVDRDKFRDELWLSLRTGFETGIWTAFDRALDRWYDTAAILGDPELAEDLTRRWDRTDEVPLTRP